MARHRDGPGHASSLHTDWSDADRPSELHVLARGGHGFGMVRQGLPSDRWPELLLAWLASLDLAEPGRDVT